MVEYTSCRFTSTWKPSHGQTLSWSWMNVILISVVAPDLEEGLDVRGHYVVCILFTYLVHYYITLPIPPRHTGYLRVDLISSCSMTFYDVLLDCYC